MIEVREFIAQDFYDMRPRMWEAEVKDIETSGDQMVEALLPLIENAPSYTLLNDGVPVASFGLRVMHDEAEAWVWFTPDVRPIKEDFEREVSSHLTIVSAALSLKKIRCGIIKGYEQQMPWVERLGFRKTREDEKEVRYELCLS